MGLPVRSNLYFKKIMLAVMWSMKSCAGNTETAEHNFEVELLVGIN